MQFFLDHDIPEPLAAFLVTRGHIVFRLREVLPVETEDSEVFAFAQRNRAIIISCNRNHFLALATANQPHYGLIILVRRKTRQQECARLLALLNRAGEPGLAGNVNFA